MCVVSMIMDHFTEKWQKTVPAPNPMLIYPAPATPVIDPEEIAEFRRLLERAREYDRKMNQPDCELEEKKQKLIQLAKELGVELKW